MRGCSRASRRPHGVMVLATALAVAGCERQPPTTPDPAGVSQAEGTGSARAMAAGEGDNQPPTAVFRTRPRADAHGVISGGTSYLVTFNLCQSTDADAGDQLRFTFDFNGDGVVDSLGHCRVTHRYEVGAYESACVPAVVCVSDRQPDHRVCRTYEVCALGRVRDPAPLPGPTPSPEPTPTPDPEPEVFTEQSIAGNLTPIASRDSWAFTGQPGTEVSIAVDTVSAETAYLMQTCVSTTPRLRDCIPAEIRDRVPCSFPPPLALLGCPRKTTVLPGSSQQVYYVIIGGFRFTRSEGLYTALVRAQPGIGALTLAVNNGDHPASVEP